MILNTVTVTPQDAKDLLRLMWVQVMSDWLADKKLDRKLLGVLSANLAAVEAWEEFESEEVLNVLEELVADVAGEPREAPTPLQLPEGTSDDEVRAPDSMAYCNMLD